MLRDVTVQIAFIMEQGKQSVIEQITRGLINKVYCLIVSPADKCQIRGGYCTL